jgi:hypothetical protein
MSSLATFQLAMQKRNLRDHFTEKMSFFNQVMNIHLENLGGYRLEVNQYCSQIYISALSIKFFEELCNGNKGESLTAYAKITQYLRGEIDSIVMDGRPVEVRQDALHGPGPIKTGEGAVIDACDLFKRHQQFCKQSLETAMRLDNDLRVVGDSFWSE